MPPSEPSAPIAAIVDYGMGNLFSVKRACESVGLHAAVTSSQEDVLRAEVVILPGVGAFGDAMDALRSLGLVDALHESVRRGKLLVGVCLGLQLLMDESEEFGCHRGLGLIPGDVVRLDPRTESGRMLKVPQVGWNRIFKTSAQSSWKETLLQGIDEGAYMYFVHSFRVRPADPGVVLSTTRYGLSEFCSSVRRGNIFGCQFHPERSASHGLQLYRNLATQLVRSTPVEVQPCRP